MAVVVLVDLGHGLVLQRELVDGDSVGLKLVHDLGLELLELGLVDGVGLGDDRDDIHFLIQFLHADEVNTLEAVTVGSDEVEADVNSGIVIS